MPCYTVSTMAVQLKVADMDLLTKALQALNLAPYRTTSLPDVVTFGAGESFSKTTGELRIRDQATASRIKQAYAAEIVKAQAKRYGWTLKQTAPFQYQITKR